MIGNRKEEGRVCCTFYDLSSFRYSPTPSENRLRAFPKKTKSVPGFEPGLLGQNAIALPLAPPPLPELLSPVISMQPFVVVSGVWYDGLKKVSEF